ncbi:MAG: excinuclease ABC subunit UvrA [Cytophagales bacterium]|nr:excinuclease ABC subunit UvrA [Cytophagales bacterium]
MDKITQVSIRGANEHNLQNVDLSFPRFSLVVITGVSGSGKSSLAFDTLYREGYYRYMRSMSVKSSNFMLGLRRPDVEDISGLSPIISISQKRSRRNPRSTVGTLTDIYHHLRLLFARIGIAYSYQSGKKMIQQTEDDMMADISTRFEGKKIVLWAPVVTNRRGNYRAMLERYFQLGFVRARIDGKSCSLRGGVRLDRFKYHTIEIWIDEVEVLESERNRLLNSLRLALKEGEGILLVEDQKGKEHVFSKRLKDPESDLVYRDPQPSHFSFNTQEGACPQCRGLGFVRKIDASLWIGNPQKTIAEGGIIPLGRYRRTQIFYALEMFLQEHGQSIREPISQIPQSKLNLFLYGKESMKGDIVLRTDLKGPEKLSYLEILEEYGIIGLLERVKGIGRRSSPWYRYVRNLECSVCQGQRLQQSALHVKIKGVGIGEVSSWSLSQVHTWAKEVLDSLDEDEGLLGSELLESILRRVQAIEDVGLPYLSLNRPLHTISGGEVQRLRLSVQLNSNLVGAIYVFDEPSIGLHARDNQNLIRSLKRLRDKQNTVVVVEHDRDMILSADHVVDVGPGAGKEGGRIVFSGNVEELVASTPSETEKNGKILGTAYYLQNLSQKGKPKPQRRQKPKKFMTLKGARGHNLKGDPVHIPLKNFVCITGLSGSGKSTLIRDTLLPALQKHLKKTQIPTLPYDSLEGFEDLDKVVEVDQSPIGRTSRSNPATYTGVWEDIRNLYAGLQSAMVRGLSSSHFSFNVKSRGRCETCKGLGEILIEHILSEDDYMPCEMCQGLRFLPEILKVRYKGLSIGEVLRLAVDQALEVFDSEHRIVRKLDWIQKVGMGYISLGQSSNTLSGGECQRLKLGSKLMNPERGKNLYVLDEPTTGLHFSDVKQLLDIIHQLVDAGNTVIIIEHNLDVVKWADYVVDLGPEGGHEGGHVMGEGSPEDIIQIKGSHTGSHLRSILED